MSAKRLAFFREANRLCRERKRGGLPPMTREECSWAGVDAKRAKRYEEERRKEHRAAQARKYRRAAKARKLAAGEPPKAAHV